jgi:glycosyl hydrolase family 113
MHPIYRPRAALWRAPILAIVLLLSLSAWPGAPFTPAVRADAPLGVVGVNGFKGVSFVPSAAAPFGSPQAAESLQKLAGTGANWVAIVAPFHQENRDAFTFFRAGDDPTPESLAQVIQQAHDLGLKVMLQPVVVSGDGTWSGLLQPADLLGWFRGYREMLGEYARLAQSTGVDLFCVGTEFWNLTVPDYSGLWRETVADVRGQYSGPLTYSANWGDKNRPEYGVIDWWDALDYIGISAYFPLSWNDFNIDPLVAGWRSYTDPYGPDAQGFTFHWFDQIHEVQQRWGKPVLFTKIGFGSYANSPGRWDVQPDSNLELSVQTNAYEATMRVWGGVEWMPGIFWAPWSSDPAAGGPGDNGESPQNKPAEEVLTRWYHGNF